MDLDKGKLAVIDYSVNTHEFKKDTIKNVHIRQDKISQRP